MLNTNRLLELNSELFSSATPEQQFDLIQQKYLIKDEAVMLSYRKQNIEIYLSCITSAITNDDKKSALALCKDLNDYITTIL